LLVTGGAGAAASEEVSGVPDDHPFAKTRMTGRVYDGATEEGITGALITVRPTYGEPRLGRKPGTGDGSVTFVSGHAGAFALKGIPPGSFDIEVSASGYMPMTTSFRKFSAVEDDEGFDFPLDRASVIEGRIADASGRPIEGVHVAALGPHDQAVRGANTRAISDANGRFVLDPVDAGPVSLVASHPGFQPVVQEVPFSETPTREVEIVLAGGRRLVGTVRSAEGPIPGARVRIELLHTETRVVYFTRGAENESGFSVATGLDGRFQMTAPAVGHVTLRATADGFRPGVRGLMIEPGAEAGEPVVADFLLEAGAELTGRVLEHDGKPATRARVLVATEHGGSGEDETDEAGRFRIGGLPPRGPYAVTIHHHANPPLTIQEKDIAGAREYRLEAPGRILGRIVDAATGQPITRYGYRVRGPVRMRNYAVSLSGSLEIEQLPPGSYTLVVEADDYQPALVEGIVVSLGQDVQGVEVRMRRGGTIEGRVHGAPNAEILVQAFIGDEGEPEFEAGTVAGNDGGFKLENLREGAYTLVAVAGSAHGEIQNVLVSGEGTVRGVEIQLVQEVDR
jgi:hypothetical protein